MQVSLRAPESSRKSCKRSSLVESDHMCSGTSSALRACGQLVFVVVHLVQIHRRPSPVCLNTPQLSNVSDCAGCSQATMNCRSPSAIR